MLPSSTPGISDHCTIMCVHTLPKHPHLTKTITFHKFRSIEADNVLNNVLNNLIHSYSTLHAPLHSKNISMRPECKWFNERLSVAKCNHCNLEHFKKRTGLSVHPQHLTLVPGPTTSSVPWLNANILTLSSSRLPVIKVQSSELLTNCCTPHLTQFSSIICPCPCAFVQNFETFFSDKVSKIKSSLSPTPNLDHATSVPFLEPSGQSTLSKLCKLARNDILALIKGSPIETCTLDPTPTNLFKTCLHVLLPVLTSIVNLSPLSTGTVKTCHTVEKPTYLWHLPGLLSVGTRIS